MPKRILLMLSIFVIALIIGISQCAGEMVDTESEIWKKMEVSCTMCHELRNPKDWSRSGWDFHMVRMFARAGLDEAARDKMIELWDQDGVDAAAKKWNSIKRKEGMSWGVK